MESHLTGELLSENYYTRKSYLKNDIIPTHKKIHENLGDDLANYYFSTMSKESRVIIGLEPPLEGPGDQMWVYPEDELNDQPKLKPVSAMEIKALTHQGILEIGDKTLQKLNYEKEQDIKNAISENDQIWKWLAKEHCRRCVKKAVKKERAIQDGDAKRIISAYNDSYKGEVRNVQRQYNLLMEDRLEEMKKKMANMHRLQGEVALMELSRELSEHFEEKIREETTRLKEHFDEVMTLEQARFAHELNERLHSLHHQIECRGVVDVLYTACSERHHYLIKQAIIEKDYGQQIADLKDKLENYREQLEQTQDKLEQTSCVDRKIRDNMKSLCKEFRKLFSYHTNMPPSQLGFMPNLEEIFIESAHCEMRPRRNKEQTFADQEMWKREEEGSENGSADSSFNFGNDVARSQKNAKLPFIIYGDMSEKAELSKKVYGNEDVINSETYLPKWLLNGEGTRAAKESLNKSRELHPRNSVDSHSKTHKSNLKNSSSTSKYSNLAVELLERTTQRTSILKKNDYDTKLDNATEFSPEIERRTSPEIDKIASPEIDKIPSPVIGSESSPEITGKSSAAISTLSGINLSDEKLSIHRDSLTLMKPLRHSFLSNMKECPVKLCKFKTIVGYDMPPHLKHLALASYDQVQTYSYENYEMATKQELSDLAQVFLKTEGISDLDTIPEASEEVEELAELHSVASTRESLWLNVKPSEETAKPSEGIAKPSEGTAKSSEGTIKSSRVGVEPSAANAKSSKVSVASSAGSAKTSAASKETKCTCALDGGVCNMKKGSFISAGSGDEIPTMQKDSRRSSVSVKAKQKSLSFKLIGEDENAKHLRMSPKCITKHTYQSVKQIFKDHPHFADSFLDVGGL